MGEPKEYRFAPSIDGAPSLHIEDRLALMAKCIADQQRAGFGEYLDIRQFECCGCGAPGFNTGWGVTEYTCGASVHSDGTWSDKCTALSGDG